jgi:hypothetical protein
MLHWASVVRDLLAKIVTIGFPSTKLQSIMNGPIREENHMLADIVTKSIVDKMETRNSLYQNFGIGSNKIQNSKFPSTVIGSRVRVKVPEYGFWDKKVKITNIFRISKKKF